MSINPAKKIEVFDLLVISFFYLFVWLLGLSFFGVFNRFFIVLGLAVLAAGLFYFRRFFPKFSVRNFLKKGWLVVFLLLMVLVFVGCLFINSSFSGDALNYWLPLSREIVRQSAIPDLSLGMQTFITSRPPFFSLLLAATFAFFGFNELFAFWLPAVFSFLTVILFWRWWRLKQSNLGLARLMPLVFLASPFVLNWGWNLMQEPLVMFFFTAFFYFLEKYEREKNIFNLILIFFSFVLCLAGKETGLLLAIPLLVFVWQQKIFRDKKFTWLILATVPMVFWWLRNYFVFGNPIFPLFNGFFRGRFYLIDQAANFYNWSTENFSRFSPETMSQFLPLLPLVLVALYVFIREKRYAYLALMALLFLLGQFWSYIPSDNIRYYYPFLGLLFFYFFYGLSVIKSRVFLSLIFFSGLFGLLASPVIFSASSFIASLETRLDFLASLTQLLHQQGFWAALVLAVFFYFAVSQKAGAKYLILLTIGFYSVQTLFIQLSWLNIWGPILFLLLVILGWGWLARLSDRKISIFVSSLIVVLLLVNTWGLNLAYRAANGYFPYPHSVKTGFLPQVGEKIRQLEKQNNNFYVLSDHPRFLNWYFDLKDVDPVAHTFLYLTDLKYNDDFTSEQTRDLLRSIGVKYLVKSTQKNYWDNFFNKVKNQPELFRLLIQRGDGLALWAVVP